MILPRLQTGLPVSDEAFDLLYPERFRKLSFTHFTPVAEARAASRYLAVNPGARVLDIGSGVGKFCMIGAATTRAHFTGVEYKADYHQQAVDTLANHPLPNVTFLHENIERVSFKDYDAFYLFNPFFEKVIPNDTIDWKTERSKDDYFRYSTYVNHELEWKPAGTRVVTFYSFGSEVPESYRKVGEEVFAKLIFWEKE